VLNYNIRYLDDEEEDDHEKAAKQKIPIKSTSEKVPTPELLHELQTKSLKYSIMAITNILIQTDKNDLIFFRKLSILSILQDHCKFEQDPQMNLRFLYLLNISLSRQKQALKQNNKISTSLMTTDPNKENQIDSLTEDQNAKQGDNHNQKSGIGEINQANKEIQYQATVSLINFLLENIFKFKSIIQIKDHSFHIEIPKVNELDKSTALVASEQGPVRKIFFFEEESYELNKISGLRLSLCLSLRILYMLSVQKKKVACQTIIENKMSQDLFQFFVPYVENGDKSGIKQIKQVVKLIKNCAEFIQLHGAILERESITRLIKLAEQAINDDFN
jgi:hypothetical protein